MFNNDTSIKNEFGLYLVQINVKSKRKFLCEIQDCLKLFTIQYGIIHISKTWLNKDTTPYYNVDAFYIVRGKKKSDGVVIYIKTKLNDRMCETKSMVVDYILDV